MAAKEPIPRGLAATACTTIRPNPERGLAVKFPAVRIFVRRLARTANWRCARCDTWNDDAYKICCVCG